VLRRYTPLRSKPRVDPDDRTVRAYITARDRECVGRVVGFPTVCFGRPEMDHVRASGALGKKSRTSNDNCVRLCSECHRYKTTHGREARPLLLAYLERVEGQRLPESIW
jgi:5-methylcytosine-specific restriction endonuclease McrA